MKRLSIFFLSLSSLASQAYGLPEGGHVVAGQATIVERGDQMSIVANDRAVIEWQNFSIGAEQKLQIQQPSSKSALLNSVTGTEKSSLLGSLQSNGKVYLVNPQGLLIGERGGDRHRGADCLHPPCRSQRVYARGRSPL
jgi:filamentous hemagglutinin family protein